MASRAPVDRTHHQQSERAELTKGLIFFRRWKNFCSTETSDTWIKQAATCLQLIWRAAGAGGGRLLMKSNGTQTNAQPRCLRHDPCWPTWVAASAAPTKKCGASSGPPTDVAGSAIATPRWLHTRNSLLSELPGYFWAEPQTEFARQPFVGAGGLPKTGQRLHDSAFACAPGLYESGRRGKHHQDQNKHDRTL